MSARESARLRTLLALGLVGLALSGCSDRRDLSSVAGPGRSTPRFQIVPGSGTWTTETPMPTARADLAVGVVDSVLYAVGGTDGVCTGYSVVQAYDPRTGTWTTKAPMPTGRYALSVGVVGGILYAVGGGANCGQIFATLEAYDPATDTWSAKAPMPTARQDAGLGVVDGIIYVVGGNAPGGPVATVEAYNPATNSWSTKAPMPTTRYTPAVGVINGILYAAGGEGTSSYVATLDAYDPRTDTWTTKASMPQPTGWLGEAGVLNGILYTVGGVSPGVDSCLATVDAYDPATDTWTEVASMPTSRAAVAVGIVGGSLYAVSGIKPGFLLLATVEAFTPAPAAKTDQTITFTSTPPNPALIGTTYTVSATASSGLSVSFTSLSPATCTVAGTVATFVAAGLCTIAADQAGNATYLAAPEQTQAIAVFTPAQAIQILITTITGMSGLPAGVANSLTAPLKSINTNNLASACGKLNAFVNEVGAKVQNEQLTTAAASQLLQAVNAIKTSLGC